MRKVRISFDGIMVFLVELVLLVGLGLSYLFGLYIIGKQLFLWAKTGMWHPVPLAEAFSYFGISLSPIYHAEDWKGLTSIAA